MDDATFVNAYNLVVYIVLKVFKGLRSDTHARAFRKMETLARAYLI